jgi:aspartate aminotransferase
LVFDSKHISIASLNEKIKARTITVNGFSKAYAMTGWRIGYAAGPKEIITKMTVVQNHIITSVTSISQKAALAGLTQNQQFINTMQKEFKRRRDFFADGLSDIPKLSFVKPSGAFYFFVCVEKFLNKQYPTSIEWCEALLEEEHVAAVPGEAFSYPGYVRMSFSTSMEDLKEALKRLKRFVKAEG